MFLLNYLRNPVKMSALQTTEDWASDVFSDCELGDKRRTSRLIKVATSLANKIGSTLASACDGDSAAVEGSYRFVRNKDIESSAIAEGGFKSTAIKAQAYKTLLALEDTTSFNYTHAAEGLEKAENNNGNVCGFYVHSVLLVDPVKGETLGLIEQSRWQRKAATRGKRYRRHEREYESKESIKWEKSSKEMSGRLGDKISDIISVCDREADVYEYLDYKRRNNQRFVVRAVRNRCLCFSGETITDALNEGEILGYCDVNIGQKSGRIARKARLALRSCCVKLKGLEREHYTLDEMKMNIVCATEVNDTATENKLSWVLLTSEPVESFEQAQQVIGYYEMRWHIEEFHKAWKTGTGAERQRMQSADNLEKMIVILGFVAVRLLQLKEAFERKEQNKRISSREKCTTVLTQEEFIVLWFSVQKNKSKPTAVPRVHPELSWAYEAIAKLGGWSNSKRTGKASWLTIWQGWYRLQERVSGFKAAKMAAEM